jgi:hypothetical protein
MIKFALCFPRGKAHAWLGDIYQIAVMVWVLQHDHKRFNSQDGVTFSGIHLGLGGKQTSDA